MERAGQEEIEETSQRSPAIARTGEETSPAGDRRQAMAGRWRTRGTRKTTGGRRRRASQLGRRRQEAKASAGKKASSDTVVSDSMIENIDSFGKEPAIWSPIWACLRQG